MANASRAIIALSVLLMLPSCGEKKAGTIPEDASDTEQFELHADVRYSDTRHYILGDDAEPPDRSTQLEFRIELLESFSGAFVLAEYDRQLRVDYCGQQYHIGDDLYERDGDAEYYKLVIQDPDFSGCEVEIGFDHGRWRYVRFGLPEFVELEVADALSPQTSPADLLPVTWSPLERDAQLQFEWSRDVSLCAAGESCELVYTEDLDAAQADYVPPAYALWEDADESDSLSIRLLQWNYDIDFKESGYNRFSDVEFEQYVSVYYAWSPDLQE